MRTRCSAVDLQALRYDPVNDFQMVSMVATASFGARHQAGLPGQGRSGVLAVGCVPVPGKLNFGSAGVELFTGSRGELMKQTAGLECHARSYRTTPAAVTGLRAGDVEYLLEPGATGSAKLPAGDLKAIRGGLAGAKPHSAISRPSRNRACRITGVAH